MSENFEAMTLAELEVMLAERRAARAQLDREIESIKARRSVQRQ